MTKALDSYRKKRDFARTSEPASSTPVSKGPSLIFVVQKHAARRLHYDFRLEVDGVLKSWPVPNGPSLNPKEKRLAIMVEDHPIDYAGFEGVVARGNYGAGQVIIWDSGTYSPDEEGHLSFGNRGESQDRMRQGLRAGKLSFTLRGRKLRGSWTLVKTSRGPKDWLLIKHKDKYSETDRNILNEDRSVQSGLTIEDLKAGVIPIATERTHVNEAQSIGGGKENAPFPTRIRPMLARNVKHPFSNPQWLFEPKLDGYRAIAFIRRGNAALRSRMGKNITDLFPEVISELEGQLEDELVLDGELVALDEKGLPDFGLLQRTATTSNRAAMVGKGTSATIVYYPFDLLYLNGVNLENAPLHKRKSLLEEVLVPGKNIRHVEFTEGDGLSFFRAVVNLGLEGMVAKRQDGRYEAGNRSSSWLKIKNVQTQEFLVGGYTEGSGARSSSFGALLLGYYEVGRLEYAGKVGSGFGAVELDELQVRLKKLKVVGSPFADELGLGRSAIHWVAPELVVQVKYAEWTDEGRLRAPVFVGIRTDLDPRGVHREVPDKGTFLGPDNVTLTTDASKHELSEVLDQLSGNQESLFLEISGYRIRLTNLNKALWPAIKGRSSITKRDMILYYVRISASILPHLRNRPLTLTRYPNGIQGKSFYQKHWNQELPDFVETVSLFSSTKEGDVEYIVVNNLPTLIWLAQIANIEIHPWMSRTTLNSDAEHLGDTFTGSKVNIESSVLNYPDFIVFDLDPYVYSGKEKPGDEPELSRRGFAKVRKVAISLKEILEQLSLSSFLKTSGKTGLHIYVPILRQHDYSVTREACELIGRFLMQQRRDVTMEWTVDKRGGKVFLDHNQNVRGKNMASIYSLRPLPDAPISTPLMWDELDKVYPTDFNIETVPERVDRLGDLWTRILDAKHDLHNLVVNK